MPIELPRRGRWRTVFNTLFAEILLWVLIILLLVWSIGVVMIYNVSGKIPDEPYDARLADNVQAIASLVQMDGPRVIVNLPSPARELLRTDTQDKVFFQVVDERGILLVGDGEIPWIPAVENQITDTVLLRDEDINGVDVRVAYMFKTMPAAHHNVLIQVAETLNKRTSMAARIVSSVIVPQFAIVPIAVLLIYIALSRGITPLHHLQDELRARRPADLTPISMTDIPAEIRPLIEALNDTMARLDESLAGQRRFIADAAHQLKTPLTGLRTQGELAISEDMPPAVQARIRHMLLAIERLSDMTQKLLVLARAEALSEKSALFESIHLAELVPEVAREWAPQALSRQIDLSFDAAANLPSIQGSALLLHELFANLLDNAIRYTPSGGTIAVRVRLGGGLVVEVEDSGIGIPPAEREKVFERFYRVLGSGVDGSGLGLPIVKEIADLHHARVSLHDAANGSGTLVRVIFRLSGTA